ncbi:MAG: 3-deoxy-manno-octulosonate cytidylyltransferase [Phycisphaerales bacterium]|nr:3-deoxy-manno-octulosonate cytidylyltransferase [Phycisphaerales bacterium]
MPGVIAVIPARLESTRFPRKALADETGLPLIIHVARKAAESKRVQGVIIASDADEILNAAREHGFDARSTRADHLNGTTRIAEVAQSLDCDLVVNVQADEPEIDPSIIDAAIEALEQNPGCQVGTIASWMSPEDDPEDPNLVKVVLDQSGEALYFSRAAIPLQRDSGQPLPRLRHVGLYVYRRDFLPIYAALEPTSAEQAEKLEQLRILEHGHRIAVAIRESNHQGIDTPEQYQAFVNRQANLAADLRN